MSNHETRGSPTGDRRGISRWWVGAAVSAALALVFLAYVQPSMLLAMTDAIWSCF